MVMLLSVDALCVPENDIRGLQDEYRGVCGAQLSWLCQEEHKSRLGIRRTC